MDSDWICVKLFQMYAFRSKSDPSRQENFDMILNRHSQFWECCQWAPTALPIQQRPHTVSEPKAKSL